jgi:MoaA/NifB/PqqE/SkfB family radical SAM enzyme
MLNNNVFALANNILLRDEPQYFESYIVFDYRKGVYHQTDLSTLRILEHLSKSPLCGECISQMVSKFFGKYSLEDMVSFGWIVDDKSDSHCSHQFENVLERKAPNWIQSLPEEKRRVAILTGPTHCTIVLTRRCNLSCVHCNVSAYSLEGPELVPLEKWKNVLDNLEQLHIFKVVLSGGEPFYYRDFDKLLRYFARKRFMKSILTNGTSITEQQLNLIKESGITLTLSLDGGTPDSHDAFRRAPGSFSALLKTLKLLREKSIPFNIVSVVHKENIEEIDKIAEIAYRYFASALFFVPLKYLGRGQTAQDWTVGMKEYSKVSQDIARVSPRFSGLSISFDEELDSEEFGPSQGKTHFENTPYGYTTCMAGKNGLVLDFDGAVYPCMVAMQMKVHPVGSILKSSVEEIWRNGNWGIFREPVDHGCRANIIYKIRRNKKGSQRIRLVEEYNQ